MARLEWPHNALKLETGTLDYDFSLQALGMHMDEVQALPGMSYEALYDRVANTIPYIHRVLTRNGTVRTARQNYPHEAAVASILVRNIETMPYVTLETQMTPEEMRKETENDHVLVATMIRGPHTQAFVFEKYLFDGRDGEQVYKVGIKIADDSLLTPGSIAPYDLYAEESLLSGGRERTLETFVFEPYKKPGDIETLRGFSDILDDAIGDLLAVAVPPTNDTEMTEKGIEPFDPEPPEECRVDV